MPATVNTARTCISLVNNYFLIIAFNLQNVPDFYFSKIFVSSSKVGKHIEK